MKLYHIRPIRRWGRPNQRLSPHLPRLLWSKQPRFVRRCQPTQALIRRLRWLDWEQLPTSVGLAHQGQQLVSVAAYVGAYLVKLELGLSTFGTLRRYLRQHPALVWALGFPLLPDQRRFDPDRSLPSQRHLSKKLRTLPNEILQTLLDSQVDWLQRRFGESFGQAVGLDTKHILAWVKENNPKTYIKNGRFDPTRQPNGDPDCKLGCKRKRNQTTPTQEGEPAGQTVSIGEYYWGYASGVVVTKVPQAGEFVLAELTQTFDQADLTYFPPLMAQVETRLGVRPPFFTADAAFDAWYVHDYFYQPDGDGFAAVPLRNMKTGHRQFDEAGLPLCEAGLAMPLRSTFTNRTSMIQHQRGRYGCPLLHPEPTGASCPVDHPKWQQGGCQLVMPTAIGARRRYQLDRESERYKQLYQQRTATERIFSQAKALGIERPKLRNRQAIANQNTLIYLLINLRAMQRLADE